MAAEQSRERSVLWTVLLLNAGLAVTFLATGVLADSSALIANGLDNLSDAAVYALSLVALGKGMKWKAGAATVSGAMLLTFSAGVLVDVGRRYIDGSEPVGAAMMAMAAGAAIVNWGCLRLLQRLVEPDVNVRAATTFSFNDFVSNGGILIAGILVYWLGSYWPDLLVGALTAVVAIRGGIEILRDARRESKSTRNYAE